MNTDKDDIKQITNEINKDNMCIILITSQELRSLYRIKT